MVQNMTYDYEYLKKEVLALTTIDLNSYKEAQMKRRIDTLITKHNIKGYDKYVQALRTDEALFDEFVNYITINVSEFYRNPDQWKLLDTEIIPELIHKYGKNLKIWSAACSTGDEPYSLVMALSKHLPMNQIKIYATDLDKQVIAKAKVGLYSEKSIAAVPDEFKKKYFTQVGPSYKISEEIKARVEFHEHNLLKDKYPTDYHMIVCRNVLIYFTEEAKDEVFRKFCRSLSQGGILFIGNTEQVINYKEIGYDRKSSFFYVKV
ncbi:MAG: protein-glutamate O-methyltransferase CheR [Lachnoclostridium sp.]|nr:protein-glutamate O-methyltransferase CheR [Lachnospira sp.]MCM1249145.1 protein-glutamate O-methyltransferase CheR [Lachnoclostridium sp.]MCM1536726.1 protein-glutamate O-methyltransferase CheR [Clostridium sp.]